MVRARPLPLPLPLHLNELKGAFFRVWQGCILCILNLSFPGSRALPLPKGRAQEYCCLPPEPAGLLVFRGSFGATLGPF